MKNGYLWLMCTLFLASSCAITPKIPETFDDWTASETPPNGILIRNNFYFDQTELSNINWLEYQFWTKRTYGENSLEYKKTVLKDSIWLNADSCLWKYDAHYLGHHAYRDYPLVGVSQEQAKDYSKWRSDRVFEYQLIKYGIIALDTNQNKESHFTIERYFNGEIEKKDPTKELLYYPEFRLPTIDELKEITLGVENLTSTYFEECGSKKCLELKQWHEYQQLGIQPCVYEKEFFDVNHGDPTRPVGYSHSSIKGDLIFNFYGNVAEWTAEPNFAFGGGWKDQQVSQLQTGAERTTEPNAWTGFRNVCEWKEWKK